MLEEILKLPEFPSSFNIEGQKKKYQNKYYGKLPLFFEQKKTISKADVIEIIRNNDNSNKEEFLAILFWGIYFKVMSRSPKSIFSLIKFIESDSFEKDMNDRKKEIIESKNPNVLFKSFEKKSHIPGLGYAYFTKLFFFYREALVPKEPSYPILDKWLSNAWCAIDGSIKKNTLVYNKYYKAKSNYFFDGALKRKKSDGYESYIQFMHELAIKKKMDVITLEAKLFGADRTKNPKNNPRNFYRNWAKENNIPIKKYKPEAKEESKSNVSALKGAKKVHETSGPFYLKKPKTGSTYYALRIEPDKTKKVGYIKKGWLHASEGLKGLLDNHILDWKDASNDGGSKEIWKYKFITEEECIDFLKDKKII